MLIIVKKQIASIYPRTAIEVIIVYRNFVFPPNEPRPRLVCMLPITRQMLTGRPRVSYCKSETNHISSFMHNYIKQFASRHPSWIKVGNISLTKLETCSHQKIAFQIP